MFKKLCLGLLLVSCSIRSAIAEKPMLIVVPSWNNNELFDGVPRYKINLDSIFSQKYSNYRVIYIDDCSSDGTADAVEQYVALQGQGHRFTLIRNSKRWGPSRNRYVGAHMAKDDEIVMYLDGDDWFSKPDVLSILNRVYDDPNIWLTYSRFIHAPDDGHTSGAQEIPRWVIDQNAYRKHGWNYHSLKTFYGWLFKRLRLEDILFEGKFFPVGSDIAEMFPLVESSGGRFKFIKDILYVASVHGANEINVSGKKLLNDMWHVISHMPSYAPLQKPLIVTRAIHQVVDALLFVDDTRCALVNNALRCLFNSLESIGTIYLVIDNGATQAAAFNRLKTVCRNCSYKNIVLKYVSDLKNTQFIESLGDYTILASCSTLKQPLNISQAIDSLVQTYGLVFYFGCDARCLEHENIPCLHVGAGTDGPLPVYAFQFGGVTVHTLLEKSSLPCLCNKETFTSFIQSLNTKKSRQCLEDFGVWALGQSKKIGLVYG